MPELPEVETVRRELLPELRGRSFVEGWTHPSTKFTPALEAVGAEVQGIARRGKYLLVQLDDNRELVVHLGMTGKLSPDGDPAAPHVRAWWRLDDGRVLTFDDVRRFGRIRVVDTGDYSGIATLAALGPEPLSSEFTPPQLHRDLTASTRRIKTQLLSQRPVAGVGNIYADEALWRAMVRPSARSITKPQAERLHEAIVAVLTAAVANRGTTLRDYRRPDGSEGQNQHELQCYGRAGLPCPRCGTELRSRVLDARTTTWCPTCQKR